MTAGIGEASASWLPSTTPASKVGWKVLQAWRLWFPSSRSASPLSTAATRSLFFRGCFYKRIGMCVEGQRDGGLDQIINLKSTAFSGPDDRTTPVLVSLHLFFPSDSAWKPSGICRLADVLSLLRNVAALSRLGVLLACFLRGEMSCRIDPTLTSSILLLVIASSAALQRPSCPAASGAALRDKLATWRH